MKQKDHYVTNILMPFNRVYIVYYISGSSGNSLTREFNFSNRPCN